MDRFKFLNKMIVYILIVFGIVLLSDVELQAASCVIDPDGGIIRYNGGTYTTPTEIPIDIKYRKTFQSVIFVSSNGKACIGFTDGEQDYNWNDRIPILHDGITYKPLWSDDVYRINVIWNDGSGSVDSYYVAKRYDYEGHLDDHYFLPMKQGYEAKLVKMSGDDPWTEEYENYIPTSDITYLVEWNPVTDVIFHVDDKITKKRCYKGEIFEPYNYDDSPEKDGSAFAGWYLDENLQNECPNQIKMDNDIDLYAKWEDDPNNIVTVTFHSLEGEKCFYNYNSYEEEDIHIIPVVKNKSFDKYIFPWVSCLDTRAGWENSSYDWYCDMECTRKFDPAQTISDNVDLYIGMRKKVTFHTPGYDYFTIRYANEDNYEFNIKEEEVDIPDYSGYAFAGWYMDEECKQKMPDKFIVSDNIEIYPKWENDPQKIANVTFHAPIGEDLYGMEDEEFSDRYTITILKGEKIPAWLDHMGGKPKYDEFDAYISNEKGFDYELYYDNEYKKLFDDNDTIIGDLDLYVKWTAGLEIQNTSIQLQCGEKRQIEVEKNNLPESIHLYYESEDDSIATVDEYGQITASDDEKGKTNIIVSCAYNERLYQAICSVIVGEEDISNDNQEQEDENKDSEENQNKSENNNEDTKITQDDKEGRQSSAERPDKDQKTADSLNNNQVIIDNNNDNINKTSQSDVGDKVEFNGADYRITMKSKGSVCVSYVQPANYKKTSYYIPDTVLLSDGTSAKVTEIAPNAFKKCKKLTKITIGSNITKIGKNAFNGCKNLKTVTIKTTKFNKKSIGKNAFKGIYKKATFKCPKKQLKNYKKWIKKAGAPKKAKYKK